MREIKYMKNYTYKGKKLTQGEFYLETAKDTLDTNVELLRLLMRKEIRPSKIVGAGLKNPRKAAIEYLTDRISLAVNGRSLGK